MPFNLWRNRTLIFLLVLTVVLPLSRDSTATGQVIRSMPVLSIAAAEGPPATMVRVAGEGFTPGGRVYIAVYDRWGVDVYENVWTTAADGTEQVTGNQDHNPGDALPGTVDEVVALVSIAVDGPNETQDPDQDFMPGVDQPIIGFTCGRDLMVRAYDQQIATWSNLLDVTALC
jgi:hypothetical protein